MASALLLATCALTALHVGCGSRTGLFAYEPPPVPVDAGTPDSQVKVKCTPGTFALSLASTQVMFVIDRSGSMDFDLAGQPNGGQKSRWRILERAITPVLSNLESTVELGAKFFPDPINDVQRDDACGVSTKVDIAPHTLSAASIVNIFQSTTPLGGTPTSEAISAATKFLASSDRRALAKYMVLATDGAPNCNPDLDQFSCVCTGSQGRSSCTDDPDGARNCLDDSLAVKLVAQAQTQFKIPTFVIGLGAPSEPAFVNTLNKMAIAGGRARAGATSYFDATSPETLNAALKTVQDGISRCTYVTPSRPDDPNAIDIAIDGVTISRSATNGWDWIDQDYGAIAFFGAACDALLAKQNASQIKGTVACQDP